MPTAILGNVAGAVVGGLLSDDKQQTAQAAKEPWGPSQDWLKANIAKGQALQQQYEQQPFNALQQQAYGNLFADLDSFRNTTAPGLLNWSNTAMMSPGYQRQQLSAPGTGGYGQRQQIFATDPGGAGSSRPGQSGLLGTPGPFATATAQNSSYLAALQQAMAPQVAQPAPVQAPAIQPADEYRKMFEQNLARYFNMPSSYENQA